MPKLLKKSKELVVEFCDRRASVCDARCRATAVREQALLRALHLGVRL